MSRRLVRATYPVVLVFTLAGLALFLTRAPAKPVPGKQDRLITQLVCNFLQKGHLARPEIDDELSRRLFKEFFKDLDPTKLYFLRSDVDEFRKFETELDDMVLQGDLSVANQL